MWEKPNENNQLSDKPELPSNENKEVKDNAEQREKREVADKNEQFFQHQQAESLLESFLAPKSSPDSKTSEEKTEIHPFPGVPVDQGLQYTTRDPKPSRIGTKIGKDVLDFAKWGFDSLVSTGKLAVDTAFDTARLVLHPIRTTKETFAYLNALEKSDDTISSKNNNRAV